MTSKTRWRLIILAMTCVSTALVLAGISDRPYGYYSILRSTVCLTALYGFSLAFRWRSELWLWTYGTIAALYNPVRPFNIGDKQIWEVLNLATIVILWIVPWMLKRNPVDSMFRLKTSPYGAAIDPWGKEKTLMYEVMPLLAGTGLIVLIAFCIGAVVVVIRLLASAF